PLVSYREDFFRYEQGVYLVRPPAWVYHELDTFAGGVFGNHLIDARYISEALQSVRHAAYIDDRPSPPFWLDSGKRADVIVTSNGIIRLDPLFQGRPLEFVEHTP